MVIHENLRLKQLDKLILRSYVAPFLMTFAIACFFLVMQFLWKYVDDLMGKGLEWYVIAELMGLASVKLVILALPLSILLSSIMVMGSFAENSELVAMKSAGMSLFRILRPLFALMLVIALGSFLFTNEVWPVANLKFRSLLYDVTKKKPTLQLQENIFYKGIEDYTIRVKDKKEGGELEDVLIYDHSDPKYKGNRRVIRAKQGSMKKTEDERYLLLKLRDGVMYQEMDLVSGRNKKGKNAPHLTSRFEEQIIRFDLMGFQLERSDEGIFSKDKEMLDLQQLGEMVDSLERNIKERRRKTLRHTARNLWILKDSGRTELDELPDSDRDTLSKEGLEAARKVAMDKVRKSKKRIDILSEKMETRNGMIRGYNIEWHRKFTLSFACVILFMIGGPLGAIIRKGGVGAPFVAGVVLFILYFILMKVGEETAGEGAIPEWIGMWAAPMLLLPLGIWLTYRAANESQVLLSLNLRSLKKRFLRK